MTASFGISSEIASGLSSNNFVARATSVTWARDDTAGNNMNVEVSVSYSASSKNVTVTWNSNYTETRFNEIYIDAFWAD